MSNKDAAEPTVVWEGCLERVTTEFIYANIYIKWEKATEGFPLGLGWQKFIKRNVLSSSEVRVVSTR